MLTSAQLIAASKAHFHLQVELSWKRIHLPPTHTPCQGTVLRVFHGADRLSPGDVVTFRLPLLERDKALAPPQEGSAWVYPSDLRSTPIMEAFLDGEPPDLALCDLGQMCRYLSAPTSEPVTRKPTAQEGRDAFLRTHGTRRSLHFRDAPVDAIVQAVAALGARREHAEANYQRWIVHGPENSTIQLSLIEDVAKLMEDPEVWIPPAFWRACEELGCEPRAALHMHWYPGMEAVAERLIRDLLDAHEGVLADDR